MIYTTNSFTTKATERHIGLSMSEICCKGDKTNESAPSGTGMRLTLNHSFASRKGGGGGCHLYGVKILVISAVISLKKRRSSAGSAEGPLQQ